MKKILIILIILGAILGGIILGTVNNEKTKAELQTSAKNVKAGETFNVIVAVNTKDMVTGMSSILSYDKTKLSIEERKTVKGFFDLSSEEELNLALLSLEGTTLSGTVNLYTVTFKVLEGAEEGKTEIELKNIGLALVNDEKKQEDVSLNDIKVSVKIEK